MPELYCPNCSRLMSGRSRRCPRCKHLNLEIPRQTPYLMLLISCTIGAVITAIYARVIYLAWPKWCKYFGERGFDQEENAEEAAILIGLAVFLLSTIMTALSLKLRPAK